MKRVIILFALWFFSLIRTEAQINFVANPSFEEYYNCNVPVYISKAKYWNNLDSAQVSGGGQYYNVCNFLVPSNAFSEQYARTGKGYMLTQLFCTSPTCSYPNFRYYTKNRLKSNLIAGKTYCAKMYVNSVEQCLYGIDAIQMLFGDATLDTVKYCNLALTYLTPQVKNTVGNIITDTINWTEVSGTFTATGNEKYLVIGNFNSDATVNKTAFNPGYPSWAGYNIDDVSVIEFDLSAYAGPDKNINLGDSAFIGRPPEIGLDCSWTTGTLTVGDSAGIWVKPTTIGTFSYVVTQNICGNVKTDTVNVNVSPGLVSENELFSQSISLFPQPANESVVLSLKNSYENELKIEIINVDGKTIGDLSLEIRRNKVEIQTRDLAAGIYFLRIENSTNQTAIKKLVIAK